MAKTNGNAKVIFFECGLAGGSVERLKVLFSLWDFERDRCGIVTFYDQRKAGELLRHDRLVEARALGVEGDLPEPLTKVAGVPVPTRHFFAYLSLAWRVLRSHPGALVYLNNTPYSHIPVILAAHALGRPVVCHLRDTISFTRLTRHLLPWIDRFVVLSDDAREHYVREGIPPEKIVRLYNAIDVRRLSAQVFPGILPENGPRAVVAGTLCERKAQDVVLQAMALVIKRHPRAQLILLGDGPAAASLHEMAHANGLSRNVHFLGYQEAAFDAIGQCEIGILASRREGLPNSVMEYMAAGLPVLVSDMNGIRELVRDGVTGYIHPTGDHHKLAADWIALLDDEGLRKRMGAVGKTIIDDEKFTPRYVVQRTREIIEDARRG